MSSTATPWARRIGVLGGAGGLALAAYTLTRVKPPFFDEVQYLTQARKLATATSLRTWLLENDTGPTGPWYALLHFALSGGTGALPVPWLRLVNLVLLVGVLFVIARCLRATDQEEWKTWLVMGVPMTWVFAGMALTELPAMIGIAAVLLGAISYRRLPAEAHGWGQLAAMALGTAIATSGRQTYLVTVPALWLVAARPQRSWAPAAALVVGMIPIMVVFAIWGGTVPPRVHQLAGGGLVPRHAVMALGIAGMTSLLIAPGFIWQHRQWAIPIGGIVAAANAAFGLVKVTTLTSVQRFLGHPMLGRAIEVTLGVLFIAAAGAFVCALLRESWQRREREFLGLALAIVLLCGVCAAITHQFNSRYVGVALPFFVLALAPWIRPTPWTAVRLIAGMLIGAAVLHSYYVFVLE